MKKILKLPKHLEGRIIETQSKYHGEFCDCPFVYETSGGSSWCTLLQDEFRKPNTPYPEEENLEIVCPLEDKPISNIAYCNDYTCEYCKENKCTTTKICGAKFEINQIERTQKTKTF